VLTLEEANTNLPVNVFVPEWRCGFSTDGMRVGAVHPGGIVQVWERASGKPVWSFRESVDPGIGILWLPDWTGVVLARSNVVEVIRMGRPESRLQLEGHTFPVRRLALTPDGQRVVAVAADDTARIWDASSGIELALFSTIPDWSLLCMSGNLARASVHDMTSGEVVFPIPVKVNSAAFCPDAKRLATLGGGSTISIWEVAERQELLQLKGHSNPVNDMAFSPDGRLLVSVDARGTVKIWSAQTGREILDHPSLVWGVSHTPDGRKVATAPIPDGVAIWDTQSGRQLAQLRRLNRSSTCVAFSPDGEHLAAGDVFGDIAIWNAGNGKLVHLLRGHDFALFGGLC
jgi:WD40 repeat protein